MKLCETWLEVPAPSCASPRWTSGVPPFQGNNSRMGRQKPGNLGGLSKRNGGIEDFTIWEADSKQINQQCW